MIRKMAMGKRRWERSYIKSENGDLGALWISLVSSSSSSSPKPRDAITEVEWKDKIQKKLQKKEKTHYDDSYALFI